jgi:hypothetical protein
MSAALAANDEMRKQQIERRTKKVRRDGTIRQMQAMVNGTHPDKERPGYLSRRMAKTVLDSMEMAFSCPLQKMDQGTPNGIFFSDELRKNVTVASGLTYYDLRAPALNLFPTVTPLRNSIPRMQRANPGDAAHWRAVTNTIGSGFPFSPWVPEGRRSASMSYQTANYSLPYMTIGEEDSLTEEARFAAMGFEDEDALVQLRLLLRTFVKEEAGLLGGNNSLALGTPATPAVSASGTGGTLPATTYYVNVVGLTQEGYLNSSVANGVATTLTITGNDGLSYTLNGGSSNLSGQGSHSVSAGNTLFATVTAVTGAVAYAWYVGTSTTNGNLQAITTINSIAISAPLISGGQLATAITQDSSQNPNYAFDGMLTWASKPSSNAYVNVFATGTAGTGTGMTSTGAGGTNEIDAMNKGMWDTSLLSSTIMYVNSQELRNITYLSLNGASAPLLRYYSATDATGGAEYKLTAGGVVAFYFNPYTPDGGIKIPINIHPNLAPGTLFAWAERLPPWYVSNAVPEPAVVQTRQDYYSEVWPKTTRAQFYGIYSQEVLAVYVAFAMGLLTNIGNVG